LGESGDTEYGWVVCATFCLVSSDVAGVPATSAKITAAP
jgi:hypothetical protein